MDIDGNYQDIRKICPLPLKDDVALTGLRLQHCDLECLKEVGKQHACFTLLEIELLPSVEAVYISVRSGRGCLISLMTILETVKELKFQQCSGLYKRI